MCIIHHECMKSWLEECYMGCQTLEFHSFSSEKQITFEEMKSFESTDIVFLDFDIYVDVYGNHKAISILHELKRKKYNLREY